MIRLVFAFLLLIIGAAMVWFRAAPSGREWHVDPEAEGRTGDGRWLVADGGDTPALLLTASPGEVLEALSHIAATDGASLIAWDPEQGRATWVVRSNFWGFPDYVSVKAAPEAGRTRVSAYARLRFGRADFGVNRTRLERWLDRLRVAVNA